MHFSEEQIQRWLHGELDPGSKDTLSRHLAACRQCAQQLAEAEREEHAIFELLKHVDHAAPVVDVETLVSRERGASAVWGRRVAGILIAAGLAGAAYAVPGSPVPGWLSHVSGWITGRVPSPTEESPPPLPVTSGISVPVQEQFTIHFTADQAGGVTEVWLTDGPNIVVRVIGGTATFTTDVDRLTIENRESTADYEIEVPRDASWVEIYVGSRRLILKDGDRFVTEVPADAQGRYVLPLAPPSPSGD